MKTQLYNPIYETTKIMQTSALMMNTQEKRRAYAAMGARQEQNTISQEAAQGTIATKSKFKRWNMNAISTNPTDTYVETADKPTLWAFGALGLLATILGIAFSWKLVKKLTKKPKKHSKK